MQIMATYRLTFSQSSHDTEVPLVLTWCSKKRAFYSQDRAWLSADAHDAGFWPIVKLSNFCSTCSPWRPFPQSPIGVGLVLLLHSFRSRSLSAWVTPTPVMSSLTCWCHVFLGRPRLLVPGIARSTTLQVTVFSSLVWTCPNQRRRPLHITSSTGTRCNMRRISLFRMWSPLNTPRIPRSILISVV